METLENYQVEFNHFRDSVIKNIHLTTENSKTFPDVSISMESKNKNTNLWYIVTISLINCDNVIINSRKSWCQFIINQGLFIRKEISAFIISDMETDTDYTDSNFILEPCRGFIFTCKDLKISKEPEKQTISHNRLGI